MSLTPKTTHIAEGLDDLIEIFKDQPNFEAWLSTILAEIQELEDVGAQIALLRSIDDSSDIQLDEIGAIPGQPRNALDDANYRAAIRAKILINKSGGTGDDILRVVAALLRAQAITAYELFEFFPRGQKIVFGEVLGVISPSVVAQAVKSSRLAGVATHVEYSEQADADTFTFASGDTEEASSAQGLGDDAATTGGAFADVIEA